MYQAQKDLTAKRYHADMGKKSNATAIRPILNRPAAASSGILTYGDKRAVPHASVLFRCSHRQKCVSQDSR